MEMLKWMIYIFEQSVYIHDRMVRQYKSLRNLYNSHWNGNALILMKLSSLATVQVVKMTIFSAFSDEIFIKITTFPLSVSYQIMYLHNSIIVLYNAIIDKKELTSMIPWFMQYHNLISSFRYIDRWSCSELWSSLIRYMEIHNQWWIFRY